MKNLVLIFASFTIFSTAQGQILDEALGEDTMCRLVSIPPVSMTWLNGAPSWFAKVIPDPSVHRAAMYIGDANTMVSLDERKLYMGPGRPKMREKAIVGQIDPVPSPDGRILTVPGLSIYAAKDLYEKSEEETEFLEPIFEDWEHSGVYQSVARIDQGADDSPTAVYRVVTDESGEVNYRDYKVDFTGPRPVVTPVGPASQLCPGNNIKTIMISKTGKYIAGYSPESQSTQIYDGRPGQGCRVLKDMGHPLGKFEFNFDDTKVTFHVDYFGSDTTMGSGYFSGVSDNLIKDVFAVDVKEIRRNGQLVGLDTSNIQRYTITTKKGAGSYYPAFFKDKKVAFVHDAGLVDDNEYYAFVVVDSELPNQFQYDLPSFMNPQAWSNPGIKRRVHRAVAVGSIWAQKCARDLYDELTAVEVSSFFMHMRKETCEQLVNEFWNDEIKSEIAFHPRLRRDIRFDSQAVMSMDRNYLLQGCQIEAPQIPTSTAIYGEKTPAVYDGPKTAEHYCAGCHVPGGSLRYERNGQSIVMPNLIDFHHLTEYQIDESIARVQMSTDHWQYMPPGARFGEGHKEIFLDYMRQLKRELYE